MIIKRLLLLLLMSSVTGSITFVYVQPEIARSLAEANETWQLPTIPAVKNQEMLLTDLRKWQLWGSEIDAKAENKDKKTTEQKAKADDSADKELAKNFVGIIYQGTHSYILLLDNDKKTKPYYLQSQLPNGALLVSIQPDAIKIQKEDGDEKTIYLYNSL